MSKWLEVKFEDEFLQEIAFGLRKRESAIHTLAARYHAGRVDDVEDVHSQGGFPYQRFDFAFDLWRDDRELRLTLYDDRSYYLDLFQRAQPVICFEGKLSMEAEAIPLLIEQTLRKCAEILAVDVLAAELARIWQPVREKGL
jgi:hypothetical protein